MLHHTASYRCSIPLLLVLIVLHPFRHPRSCVEKGVKGSESNGISDQTPGDYKWLAYDNLCSEKSHRVRHFQLTRTYYFMRERLPCDSLDCAKY